MVSPFISTALTSALLLSGASFSDTSVIDNAELFTSTQETDLEKAVTVAYNDSDLVFVVETKTTLNGETLEEYSMDRANQLAIGDAQKDNGVYILIVSEDRDVRIELGDGTEAYNVTSDTASQVMDEVLLPQLKNNDYFNGVTDAVEALADAASPATIIPEAVATDDVTDNATKNAFLTSALIVAGLLVAAIIGSVAYVFIRNRREFQASQRVNNRNRLLTLMLKNQTLRSNMLAAKNKDERYAVAYKEIAHYLESDKSFREIWFTEYMSLLLTDVTEQAVVDAKLPGYGGGDFTVKDGESLGDVVADKTESFREKAQMIEKERKKEEKERQERHKLQDEAATLWEAFDDEQRKEFRDVSKPERTEVISSYGYDERSAATIASYLLTFSAVSTMDATPQKVQDTTTSSSRSSSDNTQTSTQSYTPSYSDTSSSSSYDGGSFSGGGGDSGSY